jgi:hypothetical protein
MMNFLKKNTTLLAVFFAMWVSLTVALIALDVYDESAIKKEHHFSNWQIVRKNAD